MARARAARACGAAFASVALASAALGVAACGGGSGSPAPARATAVQRPAVRRAGKFDTTAVLDTLRALVRARGLTTLAPECYDLYDDPDSPPFSVEARERHNAHCGGDPDVAPRLFSLRYDPATGAVLSDAGAAERGDDEMDTLRAGRRVP